MRRVLPLLIAAAIALAGCGTSAGASPHARNATLVLDFTPNAVHAGIYTALARGYARAAGVALRIITPTASTDSIRLLETGRANFAILDIHDLAIARERGADVVGIMAIVERPLAAVIAAPPITDPRALAGKTVGVTGDPSDLAVLRSVIAGSGGHPKAVKTVTIGFDAVAALLSGRVAAATAFWNDEGITLAHDRPGFHVFRVDQYGAPPYPELVLCATGAQLRGDPALAQAVVKVLVRGYQTALADPASAIAALEREVPGIDRSLLAPQLQALLPAFKAPDGRIGDLQPTVLAAWARWEARFGIVARAPDVAATFDRSFVAAATAPAGA
ncbi:MAG: ABC transporter substrate-binding protein [Solirubrobacteraceae bacterium]|jgi:ABC-type nitrate/sulfonate/bicarbonate transport system substrate-binding protein